MAQILNRLGRTDEAIQKISEAIHIKPWLSIAVNMKAKMLISRYDYKSAIMLAEEFSRIRPDTDIASDMLNEILLAQGGYLMSNGSPEKAIESFSGAYSLKPEYKAMESLVSACIKAGKYRYAESIIAEELKKDPESSLLNHLMGGVISYMNDYDNAYKYIAKAVEAEPENPDYLNSISSIEFLRQNFKSAEIYAKKSLTLKPDFIPVMLRLGDIYTHTGNFSEAQVYLQRAIELAPENYMIKADLMIIYSHSGEYKKAEEIRLLAGKKAETDSLFLLRAGIASTIQEKYVQAIEFASKAIDINNNCYGAYLQLGLIYLRIGNLDKAEEVLRQLLFIKPDYDKAYVNLALVLFEKNALVDALNAINMAIKLNPEITEAYTLAFNCNSYLATYEDTLELSDKALSLALRKHEQREMRLYSLSYHPYLSDKEIFQEFEKWGVEQSHLFKNIVFRNMRWTRCVGQETG